MKYIFDEDKRELYSAIIVLDAIYDKGHRFVSNLLSLDDQLLLPVFNRMVEKGLLIINDDHVYVPTDKGTEFIENFYQRYGEFIKLYDLYCAVDLTAGEFAFSKILDMEESEFQKYLVNDRWEDVRVAVCEFKKIDAMQIVFLSFVRENRIDTTQIGWQKNLVEDAIWDEITNICNSAVSAEYLSKDDQIKNIVITGSELLKTLLEREKQEQEAQPEPQEDTTTTTTTTTVVTTEEVVDDYYDDPYYYYEPYYYDPFYISPCWDYYYDTPYWW